jgi:DNA modification methylase
VFTLDADELKYLPDIWIENRDKISEYVHPTQKPVRLVYRAIRKSLQKDGTVIDLFGGSGSTMSGCEQTGRVSYTMELDPYYCDVIRKRYQKLVTGAEEGWQEATKAV